MSGSSGDGGPLWGPGASPPPRDDDASGEPGTGPSDTTGPTGPTGKQPPVEWTPPPSSGLPPAAPPGPMWGEGSAPLPAQRPSGPPLPPPPGPMWAAGAPPPAAAKSGMSGCVKALLIVGVLLIVLIVAAVFALEAFVRNVVGPEIGADGSFAECELLSDGEARAVLGGNADAIELTGFFDASIGFIIDKRVLADAADCWVGQGERSYIARVARYEGPDATGIFAAEREAAQSVTVDEGEGINVIREGYDAGDAPGIGDEAFCTGISSAIMAGVLVRQGDTVVYVSVGPPNEGDTSVPDMQPLDDGTVAAPGLCSLAQELARSVLD